MFIMPGHKSSRMCQWYCSSKQTLWTGSAMLAAAALSPWSAFAMDLSGALGNFDFGQALAGAGRLFVQLASLITSLLAIANVRYVLVLLGLWMIFYHLFAAVAQKLSKEPHHLLLLALSGLMVLGVSQFVPDLGISLQASSGIILIIMLLLLLRHPVLAVLAWLWNQAFNQDTGSIGDAWDRFKGSAHDLGSDVGGRLKDIGRRVIEPLGEANKRMGEWVDDKMQQRHEERKRRRDEHREEKLQRKGFKAERGLPALIEQNARLVRDRASTLGEKAASIVALFDRHLKALIKTLNASTKEQERLMRLCKKEERSVKKELADADKGQQTLAAAADDERAAETGARAEGLSHVEQRTDDAQEQTRELSAEEEKQRNLLLREQDTLREKQSAINTALHEAQNMLNAARSQRASLDEPAQLEHQHQMLREAYERYIHAREEYASLERTVDKEEHAVVVEEEEELKRGHQLQGDIDEEGDALEEDIHQMAA